MKTLAAIVLAGTLLCGGIVWGAGELGREVAGHPVNALEYGARTGGHPSAQKCPGWFARRHLCNGEW